jgi:cell division cycle protein 37
LNGSPAENRWRQRDIHEKREQRKQKIAKLHSELELNKTLRPRIQTIADGVSSKGVDYYRSVQRRIKENPSDEKPATGAANQPTYDMMIGQLLGDVFREGCWIMEGAQVTNGRVMKDGKVVDEKSGEPSWSTGEIPENKKEGLKVVLEERLDWHLKELDRRDKEVKVEIETEEAENKKKITSEDMTEGWNTSSVTKAQASVIDDKPKVAKKAQKEQTIEVLNPGASVSCDKVPLFRLELTTVIRPTSRGRGRRGSTRIRSSHSGSTRIRPNPNWRLREVVCCNPKGFLSTIRNDTRFITRRSVRCGEKG